MTIYRVKERMINTNSFDCATIYPVPNKGTGGQSNWLLLNKADVKFIRELNHPVVQQMAIQPKNRSIYIIDPHDPAMKKKNAWMYCVSLRWPMIAAQGGLVEVVEQKNGYGRLLLPTPPAIHTMGFGFLHRMTFNGYPFSMPLFSPIGRSKTIKAAWMKMSDLE